MVGWTAGAWSNELVSTKVRGNSPGASLSELVGRSIGDGNCSGALGSGVVSVVGLFCGAGVAEERVGAVLIF